MAGLGAYFSPQGIAFPQAVGSVEPLVAYRRGILGSGAPRFVPGANLPNQAFNSGSLGGDILYQGNGVRLETDTPDSSSTSVFSDDEALMARINSAPANSWHDGIFAAQDGGNVGPMQAYNSGSLGLPLYINGRQITKPMTIRHGSINGCSGCGLGADAPAADPASTPAVVSPTAPSASTPVTIPVVPAATLPSTVSAGIDPLASIIDLGSPATLADMRAFLTWVSLLQVGGNSSAVPPLPAVPGWSQSDIDRVKMIDSTMAPPAQRGTLSNGMILGPDWLVGSQSIPTPAWILYLAAVMSGAGTANGNVWQGNAYSTPFFLKTIPQYLAAYSAGKQDWAQTQTPISMLNSIMLTAPDGTVIQGGKVTISGATVTPGTPGYVAPHATSSTPKMLMLGGVAIGLVGLAWAFWPKKRR
jgi:hypothetical protein